jgi:hypothetical protein
MDAGNLQPDFLFDAIIFSFNVFESLFSLDLFFPTVHTLFLRLSPRTILNFLRRRTLRRGLCLLVGGGFGSWFRRRTSALSLLGLALLRTPLRLIGSAGLLSRPCGDRLRILFAAGRIPLSLVGGAFARALIGSGRLVNAAIFIHGCLGTVALGLSGRGCFAIGRCGRSKISRTAPAVAWIAL